MILVHILRDGVVLVPPFPAPKISRLLHARSILPTDYFWHEGMSEWRPVSTRWEPDDRPETADITTATSREEPRAPLARATPVPSRRERASLLHASKRRYHETLVPWARSASAG